MSEISINSLQNKKFSSSLKDYKDRTDPKYSGPGTWDTLTRLAVNAITHELEIEFNREMTQTCVGFPCHVCAGHCQKYIKENPIENNYGKYIIIDGKKIMIGMFIWIWKFHNVVNERLNKPLMSWDTAYNLYYQPTDLFCSTACMEAEMPKETVKTKFKMVKIR